MDFSDNKKRDLKSILPKHQVGDELWNKIEDQLKRSNSMPRLPRHAADAQLWNNVSLKLDTEERRQNQKKTIRLVSYVASVAASFIIVLLLSGVFRSKDGGPESVVVRSVEVVNNQPMVVFASQQTLPDSERINVYCSNFPNVCEDPEFVQLKNRWQKLKTELANLKSLPGAANTEKVNHYIARIEMDIRQIEDKMMHKFL